MIRLVPPRKGKTTKWAVRGTHLGVSVNQSTGATSRSEAHVFLKELYRQIEEDAARVASGTFDAAAVAYLKNGGSERFLEKIRLRIGSLPLCRIDQACVDRLASQLYPAATSATRNRQVYSPVMAVLNYVGTPVNFRRPRGADGKARVVWLWPEQFERLATAAGEIEPELEALFLLLVYTGLRISEGLGIKVQHFRLTENFVFVSSTKNGEPRAVFLPPSVVTAITNVQASRRDRGERLFRWTRSGSLYAIAEQAYSRAGIDDHGAPFHILRHTYGTWMRRYAGADDRDLTATGAWKDVRSVARYAHTIASEAAKRAARLPGATRTRDLIVDDC